MKQNQNYETLKKINNLSAKEKEELANKANIRNKDQLFTAVKMLAEKSEELGKNFGGFLIDFRRKNNNSELLDEYLKVKQIYEQREKDLFNNLNDGKNNSGEKAGNKNRYTLNENERQNQLQGVLGLIQEHKNEIEGLGNRQAFGEYIEAYNALDTFYNKNSNKAKRLDKYNELTNKLNSLYESFEDDFKGNESLLKKESDLYTHIEHVDDILLLMTKLLGEIPNPSQREGGNNRITNIKDKMNTMKNIRTDLLHTIEKVETIYKSEINQIASKAKETNKNKKEQAEKQAYQETFDKLVAKLL